MTLRSAWAQDVLSDPQRLQAVLPDQWNSFAYQKNLPRPGQVQGQQRQPSRQGEEYNGAQDRLPKPRPEPPPGRLAGMNNRERALMKEFYYNKGQYDIANKITNEDGSPILDRRTDLTAQAPKLTQQEQPRQEQPKPQTPAQRLAQVQRELALQRQAELAEAQADYETYPREAQQALLKGLPADPPRSISEKRERGGFFGNRSSRRRPHCCCSRSGPATSPIRPVRCGDRLIPSLSRSTSRA